MPACPLPQRLPHLSVSELNRYIEVKNTIGGESVSEEMWLKLHRLHFTEEMSRWITLPVILPGFRSRLGSQ